LNSELCRKALEKVGNPNVLVNIVSRRLRQLTSGGGSVSRPLIANADHLGAADIALTEIIDGKLEWNIVVEPAGTETTKRKRRRS
jgi:DNA-directed RNA polymerase subunit omega